MGAEWGTAATGPGWRFSCMLRSRAVSDSVTDCVQAPTHAIGRCLEYCGAVFLVLPRSQAFLLRPAALVGPGARSLVDELRNLDKTSSRTVCATMAAHAEQLLVKDSSSAASHWSPTVCSGRCLDRTKFEELQYFNYSYDKGWRTVQCAPANFSHKLMAPPLASPRARCCVYCLAGSRRWDAT